MVIKSIEAVRKIYTSNMRMGRRKVGMEQEWPMVYSDKQRFGKAVMWPDTLHLLESIRDSDGWEEIKDDRTQGIVGLKKKIEESEVTLGTDFGSCTLELALIPCDRLDSARATLISVMKPIVSIAEDCNIFILGYGIQPRTPPSKKLVPPKSRYRTLDKRFWTTERLSAPETDVHYHTINASNQVHIDVGQEEAVAVVNMLNAFAPAMIAVCGNSQVWNGRIGSLSDPREKFWDWVVNIPQDSDRKGIAPRMNNLGEYLTTIMQFQPVLTARDGTYWEYYGCNSLNQYLNTGKAAAVVPGDRANRVVRTLTPEPIDIYAHDSFVWWDARLKSAYGTVELRCCAQQPWDDIMTVSALALGLIANLDKTNSRVARYDFAMLKAARNDSIRKGLNAHINGEPITYLAQDMLDLAKEGLTNIGENTKYLEPIQQRIKTKRNPSAEAAELYRRGGIDSLINGVRLKL